MRVFLAAALYSYRGAFALMAPMNYFASKIVLPLTQVAFFSLIGAFGGSQPLDFYLIGNAMAVIGWGAFAITFAISEERAQGTLAYLVGTPANRAALFFGRTAMYALDGLFHVVIAFAWARLVFGLELPVAVWLPVFLSIVTGTLAVSGLALLLGAVSYLVLDAVVLGNLSAFILLLLSGANVPLNELPAWISWAGYALPLTRSIEAARTLAAGGPLSESFPLLVQDLLLGAAYAVLGFMLFNRIEDRARKQGTLELV